MRITPFTAACVTVFFLSAVTSAAEPHEKWLAFLPGSWQWTASDNQGGDVTYSPVPGGYALTGKAKAKSGATSVWLWGWDPGTKKLIDVWFSSDGDGGRVESDVTEARLIGKYAGTIGGKPATAKITVQRASDDRMEIEWTELTVGGEPQTALKLTATRKK